MRTPRRKPWISRQEWKWFWLITLGLSVLGGGGAALTAWLTRPEEPKNLLPTQSPFRDGGQDAVLGGVRLSDFDLPAPGGQWLDRPWLSGGGADRAWSLPELEPFWTPVDQIPLTRLPQENRERLRQLFEAVP